MADPRKKVGIHTLRLHLLKCAACIIHLALSKQLAVRTLNCKHRIHSVKCKECSSLGTRNIEEMCAQYHAWSQCSMAACYMLHITRTRTCAEQSVQLRYTLHVTRGPGQCVVCSYVTCYMLHVTRGHGQSVLQCQCVVCSVTLVSIPGRCPGTRPPVAPWETAATAPSHCNPSTTTTLCTHPQHYFTQQSQKRTFAKFEVLQSQRRPLLGPQ